MLASIWASLAVKLGGGKLRVRVDIGAKSCKMWMVAGACLAVGQEIVSRLGWIEIYSWLEVWNVLRN